MSEPEPNRSASLFVSMSPNKLDILPLGLSIGFAKPPLPESVTNSSEKNRQKIHI